MNLPSDPMILVSYLNTLLRDKYNSLRQMCDDLEIDEDDLERKLNTIDYHYNKKLNKFV